MIMSTPDDLYREHEKLKAQGNYDEALAKLSQSLELDPNFVDAHLALAVLYGRMNRHEDAVRHGELACQLAPNEPFNFTALSVTYQRAWQGTGDNAYIHKAEDAKARAHMLEGRH
jgi:tetratricopeptide (TPR) repeat protein